METIFKEILKEQEYAYKKWGTTFDDNNTINDWATYIIIYLGKATAMNSPVDEQRKQLLKVANLAVSAIRAFDRNKEFPPRHYD